MLPGVAADSAEAQPFWVGCVVCVPGWKSIFYFFFFKLFYVSVGGKVDFLSLMWAEISLCNPDTSGKDR